MTTFLSKISVVAACTDFTIAHCQFGKIFQVFNKWSMMINTVWVCVKCHRSLHYYGQSWFARIFFLVRIAVVAILALSFFFVLFRLSLLILVRSHLWRTLYPAPPCAQCPHDVHCIIIIIMLSAVLFLPARIHFVITFTLLPSICPFVHLYL